MLIMIAGKSFGPRLNIQRLLMELETYITQNTSIPFTDKVIVERNAIYDLIDNIRAKLPEEILECEKFLTKNQNIWEDLQAQEQNLLENVQIERKKVIEAAQKEAEGILAKAHQAQSPILAEVTQQTQKECNQIIQEAKNEAEEIIAKANLLTSEAQKKADEIILEAQKVYDNAIIGADRLIEDYLFFHEDMIKLIDQGRQEIKQVMPKNKIKRKKQN